MINKVWFCPSTYNEGFILDLKIYLTNLLVQEFGYKGMFH